MTVLDDWARYVKEQTAGAERWARENPLASGFVIVVVAVATTFAANEIYKIMPKS